MKTQSKRTDQKDSSNQVKRQQQILRTVKGSALIGSGVSGGIGAVRIQDFPEHSEPDLNNMEQVAKQPKNIIKEGYLDPGYGGAEGGVTKSMMLPKEFLERAKGYSFISGKNSDHPFHSERNFLSPLADVVTRKIQVAGYKGSKAGKIEQFHLDLGRHFIGGILALPMKALETVSKNMTLENYEKTLHQMAQAAKIATSPPLGMLGVGKTLYIPGTDEYFNSDRFKYDPDDNPFGNPLKMQQSMTSEKGGFGGNALKTKEKVRAFGDRFSATNICLRKKEKEILFAEQRN
ncbi:unnamed protein product [Sphagnum balticum]